MGIVRLAKLLKQLNCLDEYDSREQDIVDKISGNRVYMDFISIVYRTSDIVISELNYLYYSLLLLREKKIAWKEVGDKLRGTLEKYRDCVAIESLWKIERDDEWVDRMQEVVDDEMINRFIDHYNDGGRVCEMIYNDVLNFIVDMLTVKIVDVENIIISFDGIPSFAKIQEQRQRRYMRHCYGEFERELRGTVNYGDESQDSTESSGDYRVTLRKEYDRKCFVQDIKKANEYVYQMYQEGRMKYDLMDRLVRADQSSPDIEIIAEKYGEGEKILIERLMIDCEKDENRNKSFIFYSPDGDSAILCLNAYIERKIENLNVIKTYTLNPSNEHNNQTQYISIKKMYTNLVEMVARFSNQSIDKIDGDKVCRDFIQIMNFYGNDFIHGIPTLEISSTGIDIIYLYSQFIKQNDFLIYWNGYKYKVDLQSFRKWIELCSENEKWLALDTYLAETDNRNRVVKFFGNIFPFRRMTEYKKMVKMLKKKLSQIVGLTNISRDTKIEKMVRAVGRYMKRFDEAEENREQTGKLYGRSFSEIFLKMEAQHDVVQYVVHYLDGVVYEPSSIYNIRPKHNRDYHFMVSTTREIEKDFDGDINELISRIKKKKNNAKMERFLFDYSKIRKMIPHDQMITTGYDIDIYLLDWRAGHWRSLLNAGAYDFCFDWKKQKIISLEKEAKRYHYSFLEMNNNELKKIIQFYVRGISWIADYYLNIWKKQYISTWSYNYDRSPFFIQINEFIKEIDDYQLAGLLDGTYEKSLVNVENYLKENLHKLYIYPLQDDVRKELEKNKFNSNIRHAFPDIKYYVVQSIAGHNNSRHYFDCRLSPYFSKCIFRGKKLTFRELQSLDPSTY